MSKPRLEVQRIKVDAQGYDSSGAYWGAGPDVFIASTPDDSEEITVRAASVKEARAKAEQELARTEANRPDERDKLGGKSRRKSIVFFEWRHPVTSQTIKIRITHARDYLVQGTDHIEIESVAPKRAPFPLTETGYLSHFIDWRQLKEAGGPQRFVERWLKRETQSKEWRKKDLARAQGDLFQWAEANAETAKRKPGSSSKTGKRPERRASQHRRRTPGRDPG